MNIQLNTDKTQVTCFAALCEAYGLKKVVISPGSRCAPLTVAFHHQKGIECYIVPDERSAAYFAIGIAQFTREPVGIICTSGTAALNYAPAIAEAYHQKLPLVAITADRPPEWVGQLDGQTVDQTGIYKNFVAFEAQLPIEINSKADLWFLERTVRDGFLKLRLRNLPVHFNVPLREPLYNLTDYTPEGIKPALRDDKIVKVLKDNSWLRDDLENYQRIIMILGMRRPDTEFSAMLRKVLDSKRVVVLYENLSNIQVENAFLTSDTLLSAIASVNAEDLRPDLVISFGEMLLSKPLKNWIRSVEADHWIVHEESSTPDVFQKVERIVPLPADYFLYELSGSLSHINSGFFERWQEMWEKFSVFQSDFMKKIDWSDMKAFAYLSENIPENSILHLGNSSPVRYAQFFSWKKGIRFYANRGTAGIDGITSTAIGMASQTDETLTLITGDVSFLYDSNALWNYYKKGNFKIIVINNQGGNIFSLIPGPDSTGLLDPYFTTNIPVSLELLCKAYGINHYRATIEEELAAVTASFYSDEQCSVLEIQTDPDVNTSVWKNFFKTTKSKMTYEH